MISRRRLLAGGVAVAAGALAGCGSIPTPRTDRPTSSASCVPRSSLESLDALAGLPLVYELSGNRSDFWFEPGFAGQLEEWAGSLTRELGSRPTQLRTYGSWIEGSGSCGSWHNAGRAFDLAAVRLGGGEVSCRYDQWGAWTGADLARRLEAYWRLAAGLHLRFAYVLTYAYNEQHHNHIHVDNGRSGAEPSTFSARSRVQVQAVQAVATHLWRRPVPITGDWDGDTRAVVGSILGELGLPGSLNDPAAWRGLLTDATRRRPG